MNEKSNVFYLSPIEGRGNQKELFPTKERVPESVIEIRWRELDERDEKKMVGAEIRLLKDGSYVMFKDDSVMYLTMGYTQLNGLSDIFITAYIEKGGIFRVQVQNVQLDDEISLIFGTLRFLSAHWKAEGAPVQSTTPLFNTISKQALLGDKDAIYELFIMYTEGKGVEENIQEATYWHTKAVEKGHPEALCQISMVYHVEHKYEKELDCLEKAVDAGSSEAQYILAGYCREGSYGIKQDTEAAMHLFECSALQLYPAALHELSMEYAKKDDEQMSIFLLALAAEHGDKEAAEKLQAVAEEKKGFARKLFSIFGANSDDSIKADAKTIMKAAERGDAVAMFFVAKAYEDGVWGMPKDEKQAAKCYAQAYHENDKSEYFKQIYFTKALETGCLDAKVLDIERSIVSKEIDDPQAAFQFLKEASAQGIASASIFLASIYYHGSDFFGIDRDIEKSVKYVKLGEKQGCADAKTFLAWLQITGSGVEKDEKLGFETIKKECEKKENSDLLHNLALLYATGKGVEKDLDKAEECFNKNIWENIENYKALKYVTPYAWFENSTEIIATIKALAEKNNPIALYLLGKCYADGTLLPYHKDKAHDYLETALEIFYYLRHIEEVQFTDQENVIWHEIEDTLLPALEDMEYNAEEADLIEDLLMKTIAGDVDAMAEYAHRLLYGLGLAKDELVGADLSLRAANAGNVEAMSNIGICYYNGIGVKEDKEKGEKWLKEAADEGQVKAMTTLTNNYLQEGRKEEFVEWLKKLAETGDAVGQYNLGQLYMRDDEVPADLPKAKYWHGKAAEQNFPDGQFAYAHDLLNEGNVEEGMEWLKKAADNNHLIAIQDLNVIYFQGEYGIEKDEEKGLEYLMKGISLGTAEAMCDLGIRLLNGDGMEADAKKGKEWIQKAAEKGSARAKELLENQLNDDKNWYDRHLGQAYVEMHGVMNDYMKSRGYDVSKMRWINSGISQKWHTFHDAAFTYNGKPFSLIIRLRMPDGKFYTPQRKGEFFMQMCQAFNLAPCMVDVNARYDKYGNIETLSDKDIFIHEVGNETPIDFNKSYNEWANYPIITSWENYRLAIDFTVNMLKEKGYKVLATNDIIGQNPQIAMDDAEGNRHYVFVRTPICPGDVGHVFAPVKGAVERTDGKLWYVFISQIVPTEYNGDEAFPNHPKNTEKWKVTSDMYDLIPIEDVIAKNGYSKENNYWKV